MSSWANPDTGPPLVSMALDLLSTLQRFTRENKSMSRAVTNEELVNKQVELERQ